MGSYREEILQVVGGKPLNGEITASGAKNAVSKILIASLLSPYPSLIKNVPNIQEVEITLALCEAIGSQIQWDQQEKTIEIFTPEIRSTSIPQHLSGANRIPILLLGALLGRTQETIQLSTLGGDKIGKRPITFHLEGLEMLGAQIETREEDQITHYFASAPQGLQGAILTLPYPSVGATENLILAGCTARGKTVIKNAAVEPEIIDLILFLQKMGVDIYVDTHRHIHISETRVFHPASHTVIFDRIEAASFALAAIATRGRVFIRGITQEPLMTFLNCLRKVGGHFRIEEDGILFFYKTPLQGGLHLETDVHPGFMTDWQQPFTVLLTQASGCSLIHETVYEHRFGYIETLNKMGADITPFISCLGSKSCRFHDKSYPHSIAIKGITRFTTPETIVIPDLRAGFAYLMAALLCDEPVQIHNSQFLNRGYENLDEKLAQLGATLFRTPLGEKNQSLLQSLRCSHGNISSNLALQSSLS